MSWSWRYSGEPLMSVKVSGRICSISDLNSGLRASPMAEPLQMVQIQSSVFHEFVRVFLYLIAIWPKSSWAQVCVTDRNLRHGLWGEVSLICAICCESFHHFLAKNSQDHHRNPVSPDGTVSGDCVGTSANPKCTDCNPTGGQVIPTTGTGFPPGSLSCGALVTLSKAAKAARARLKSPVFTSSEVIIKTAMLKKSSEIPHIASCQRGLCWGEGSCRFEDDAPSNAFYEFRNSTDYLTCEGENVAREIWDQIELSARKITKNHDSSMQEWFYKHIVLLDFYVAWL